LSKWQIFILGFVLGCIFGIGSLLAWAAFKMRDRNHAVERTTTVGGSPDSVLSGDPRLVAVLETVRQKFQLPALGGALVGRDGTMAVGVVGERVKGRTEQATIDDSWHLGSDTKAMTAAMIAALVEQKKLSWDTRLSDVFPDLNLPADKGAITLLELLSHRAGLPANTDWWALSKSGTLAEQRVAAVAASAPLTSWPRPGPSSAIPTGATSPQERWPSARPERPMKLSCRRSSSGPCAWEARASGPQEPTGRPMNRGATSLMVRPAPRTIRL
jgi:hypothetical protein